VNPDLVSASPYVAYLTPLLVVGALMTRWGKFKLDRGNAAKQIVDSAASAVKILRSECDALEQDLEEARQQVKSLTSDLATAQAEITDLRGQVGRMSKELTVAHEELSQLRGERGTA
jgi:outer membrane murein-binding lipoprotein Lpp